MLCNITQNSMGHTPRGGTQPGPAGGYPARSGQGGTLLGGYPGRVPSGQVRMEGTQVGYHPWPGQDGGYPGRVPLAGYLPRPGGTLPWGGTQVGYPHGRVPPSPGPGWRVPCQEGDQDGGYPVRTTEGVLTTRRAVCLLRSRRRTFLLGFCSQNSNVLLSSRLQNQTTEIKLGVLDISHKIYPDFKVVQRRFSPFNNLHRPIAN